MVGLSNHASHDAPITGRGGFAARGDFLKPVLLFAALAFSSFDAVLAQQVTPPSPSPEDIVRNAARDGLITDDEIYAYGCAIVAQECHYDIKPSGMDEADCFTVILPEDRGMDIDTIDAHFRHSCKQILHIQALETGLQNAADFYLTTAEFVDFHDKTNKAKQHQSLEKVAVTWVNTDSSSECSSSRQISMSLRQSLQSPACYGYVLNHEFGHAKDYFFSNDVNKAKSFVFQSDDETFGLVADGVERCFHTKENRADAHAIRANPLINLRGSYDFFIGAKPTDRSDFQKNLDFLKVGIPGDVHDTDLNRFKAGMLIAGRAP